MTKLSSSEAERMSPREFRQAVRSGDWTGKTQSGRICPGYAQMNLTIVPKEFAFEFLLFCHRNSQVFSVTDVTEPGNPHPMRIAPDADIRTDLPCYRVFKNGELVAEPPDIRHYWRDDLVGFLTGCTLGHEWLLEASNVKFRYAGSFVSNIQCIAAGRFSGPMVVGCRLVKGSREAVRAVEITSRNPAAHGAPVFIGTPAAIGIDDITANYKGERLDYPPPQPDEIPMFWGNGNTCQTEEAAKRFALPLMIVHKGSYMFVSDKLTAELAIQ